MPIFVTYIILPIVIFIAGTGAGWTVKDWKDGAKIKTLESRDAVVTAANDKCKTDVVTVKAGVKEVSDAMDAKQKAADAAMKDAQFWAGKHSRLAQDVNSLPVRTDESVCDAVTREQREYVEKRKNDQ